MSEDKHDLLNLSEEERKKEREKSFINKLINKQIIIKSVSFKKHDFQLLSDFMEKANLEKTSYSEKDGFSALTRKAMAFYLLHHPLPNPQVTLERSVNLNMPVKPSNVCCVPHCRTTARFILMLKNFKGTIERFPVCHKHRNWKHPKFRWLVGKKELKT